MSSARSRVAFRRGKPTLVVSAVQGRRAATDRVLFGLRVTDLVQEGRMNKHLRASAKDEELADFKTVAEPIAQAAGLDPRRTRKTGTRNSGEPAETRRRAASAR